ncbi:MAG: hypothetical protein GVY13_18745 [Alphaproteobacteria bacterium]|jgi:hypothetical protein|nr:hypothetical protein [Alphaproteobacteria bacterium]
MSEVIELVLEDGLTEEDRERVLSEVSAIEGVSRAGLIRPSAKTALARKLGFAMVDETSDQSAVLDRIRGVKAIRSAEMPSQRFII